MWQSVLVLPFLVLVGLAGLNAWRMYVVYRDVATRTTRDVSIEHRPLPPALTAWGRELRDLGFARLGEVEVTLPSVGLLAALTRRQREHTGWILTDAEGTTIAEVTKGVLEFSSRLGDGSYVVTMHPIGESIDVPGLYAGRVRATPREAYRQHVATVERRAVEHGQPRPVRSMADLAAHDHAFRAEHGRRRLRRPLIRALMPLSVAAALIVGLLVLSLPAIDTIASHLEGR